MGIAVGASASVGQPLHATLLVAIEDLVAGLAGDAKLPAEIRHWLAGSTWSPARTPKIRIHLLSNQCVPLRSQLRLLLHSCGQCGQLKLGEHLDGTLQMHTTLFGVLQPGAYRIEAVLSGWVEEKFTDEERSEVARMPYPFLRGEGPQLSSQ